jgi:hypothetical protein
MRRRNIIQAAAALLVAPRVAMAAATQSVVVAELFTSEGCSSCPPADALLLELARRPGVVALAWHVDYWNNLGWRDPYASAEWTRRQRRYAGLLNSEVFTPALVINGSQVVVGSDRSAVAEALSAPYSPSVATELRRSDTGLTGRIGARPDTASVTLIVYDSVRATSVRAGENSGRVLHEGHIVRSAEPVDVAGGGDLTLPGLPRDQGAVLLVQDRGGRILGVAEVRPASEALL